MATSVDKTDSSSRTYFAIVTGSHRSGRPPIGWRLGPAAELAVRGGRCYQGPGRAQLGGMPDNSLRRGCEAWGPRAQVCGSRWKVPLLARPRWVGRRGVSGRPSVGLNVGQEPRARAGAPRARGLGKQEWPFGQHEWLRRRSLRSQAPRRRRAAVFTIASLWRSEADRVGAASRWSQPAPASLRTPAVVRVGRAVGRRAMSTARHG